MNPNFPYPHSDANSSSLAHLNHLPPGTNPTDTPDPNPAPPPPQLHNRAHPPRAPLKPEEDLMDVDTGTDTSSAAHASSPDHAPGRGLKRARPATDDAEALEHSEPVYKQRRTGSPEPVGPAMDLSPEALQNALLDAVTHGKLNRLQSLLNQTQNFENVFDDNLWEVAAKHGHVAVIDWLSKQVDRLDLPKPQYLKLFEIAAGHGQMDLLQWLARQVLVIKGVTNNRNNALTLAVKAGHLEVVKYLAEHGCNIQQVSKDGNNALTLAAQAGHLDFVKWLIEQGCNIQQVNLDDNNALTLAAQGGHLDVVKFLAGQGCNIQQVNYQCDNALTFAAQGGYLEVVKYLAGQGCNIQQVNSRSDNALTLAAHGGHLEVVKFLAGQGCDIHHVNSLSDNALTLAAHGGHLEVVKYLAGQGCNIHQVDYYRNNALTRAARCGHLEVVKYLAGQGCNIQQVNSHSNNALTLAACGGHLEVVKFLAGQGCDIQQLDVYGCNALSVAARGGHLEVVKYLAGQGCNIQQVNNEGDNALTHAASDGHLEVVKYLAGQGCNIQQVNNEGDNALSIAAKVGHLELVKYLAGQGCNIQQVNSEGDNALTHAASYGQLEVVKYLAGQGCNIHQVDTYGYNALSRAAQANHLGTVQYLAEKGLNINQVDSRGYTALALSMKFGYSDIACDLIMRGADLTIGLPPDPNGYLFRALEIGNTALIKLLISRYDVSEEFHSSGITPLMFAANNKLIEVAIPLIQATLRLPDGKALVHEAWEVSTDPLFKELLNNPIIIHENPPYSWLRSEGHLTIQASIVRSHVFSKYAAVPSLQNQLGSNPSMTSMQKKSALVGILAELPAWKIAKGIEKIFSRKLTPSLLPIQKKVATFISEDIEVLATQATGWEDAYLVPVIENLYPSCLMHALSAHPASGIIKELTDKGLYHPIARRIASAWTSAWVAMSEEATPLLRPTPAAQIEDWDLEDLADLDPTTGDVVIRPDTVARNIDSFVGTPVGFRLLQAFCAALKDEFDAVESRILHTDDVNLPPESKNLYADLMMRQLHLIAQFWRAEPS